MKKFLMAITFLSIATVNVAAQDRYQLMETTDGTVRLDRQTGVVSHCRKVGASLACFMAADERIAMLKANEELSVRIEALEERIAAMERTMNSREISPEEEKMGGRTGPDAEEPTIDQAMRVTERVMRQFIAMVKELRRELEEH